MMGASGSNEPIDISQYLINYNAQDWANQANQYIQSALTTGLGYSEDYNKAALDVTQDFQNRSKAAQGGGYNMAQALNAPQRMAAYNALDRYQDTLGLARPSVGSYQLSNALENTAKQQMGLLQQVPQQQQNVSAAFNQGLLGPVQKGV